MVITQAQKDKKRNDLVKRVTQPKQEQKGFEAKAVVERDKPITPIKKEVINIKTGQRTTDPRVAERGGFVERTPKKQTFQIGDVQLSKEEFESAKGRLGFKGKGGIMTPNVKRVLDIQKALQEEQDRLNAGGLPKEEFDQKQKALDDLKDKHVKELQDLKDKYLTSSPEEKIEIEQEIKTQGLTLSDVLGIDIKEIPSNFEDTFTKREGESTLRFIGRIIQGSEAGEGELIGGALPIGGVGGAGGLIGTSEKVAKPIVFNGVKNAKPIVSNIKKVMGYGGGIIGIGSAGAIFNALTEGSIKEIEGDMTQLRTGTRDIVTDVTKGADPMEAIEMFDQILENYDNMEQNLKERVIHSPMARIRGKTIEPQVFRDKNAMIRRRQAIERFIIDGDVEALSRIIGADIGTT